MKVLAGRLQPGWDGAAAPVQTHTCRFRHVAWLVRQSHDMGGMRSAPACPLQRVPLLPTSPAGAEFQAWGPGDQDGETPQVKNSGRHVAARSTAGSSARPPSPPWPGDVFWQLSPPGELLANPERAEHVGPISLPLPPARPPASRRLVCGLCGRWYLISPSVTSPLGGESPGHTSSPPAAPCRFGELSKDEEDVFNWADTSAPAKFL